MNSIKLKSVSVKIAKYIGLSIIFMLILMTAAPYVFSDRIKEEIKKAANTKLSGELDYSEANVSFFKHFPSLTLTLEDFNLNGSPPYQQERLITAKEVSFGINISSLIFKKTISIDEIYIENSVINVKVNKDGIANYNVYITGKEVAKKEKDSEPTSLRLEHIEIKNSKIIYDDQSTKIHFDAIGFNYIGKGNLDKDIFDLYSKAKIEKLNLLYENEPYLISKKIEANLITKVNITSLSFVFEQNNLKINQLPVDFKGSFSFIKDGFNMDFIVKSTNNDLSDLFTAFPPKYITWLHKTELKGKTDLLLTLKGKYIPAKNIAPDFNLDLKIRDGFINYNKSAIPVSNLNIDLSTSLPSLNPDLLIIDARSLSVNIGEAFFKSKLYIKGMNNPEIKASFSANMDLEKLNRAIGIPDFKLKGILVGEGKVKGIYNQKKGLFPVTDLSISLKNGYVLTKYYPNPITDIKILTKINNQKGTFDNLKIKFIPTEFSFEGKPFMIKADLSNFDDLKYDIKANGTLDIGKIYKVFSQKGLDADGSIIANLALKGKQSDAEKGNYSKLQNKGTLEIRNILVTTEYLPKKILIKEGVFKINQDKMSFQNFLATYGQSDFKMNGYLQNVFNYVTSNGVLRGSFALNSRHINTNEFMSITNEVASTDKTSNKSETKSTGEEIGVIIIPKNLNIQFTANAQKVDFNGLNLKEAKGKINMKNGILTMQDAGFNLIGCFVNMNANYEAITAQKAKFDYHIKTSDFDIKKAYNEIPIFREMASSAEKAEGKISLDYKLKGRLNSNMEPVYPSLVGNGVLSIKDIKMKGMKMFNTVARKTANEGIKNPELSKVDIKSSIKNNIITLERFKFKFAGFRPRIEGSSSLDGKLNIKMRLGLPPLGLIGVPLSITGSKDNPIVKIGRKTEELEEIIDTESQDTIIKIP